MCFLWSRRDLPERFKDFNISSNPLFHYQLYIRLQLLNIKYQYGFILTQAGLPVVTTHVLEQGLGRCLVAIILAHNNANFAEHKWYGFACIRLSLYCLLGPQPQYHILQKRHRFRSTLQQCSSDRPYQMQISPCNEKKFEFQIQLN